MVLIILLKLKWGNSHNLDKFIGKKHCNEKTRYCQARTILVVINNTLQCKMETILENVQLDERYDFYTKLF